MLSCPEIVDKKEGEKMTNYRRARGSYKEGFKETDHTPVEIIQSMGNNSSMKN